MNRAALSVHDSQHPATVSSTTSSTCFHDFILYPSSKTSSVPGGDYLYPISTQLSDQRRFEGEQKNRKIQDKAERYRNVVEAVKK